MKTVVYGLFDDIGDARRVLEQLVQSPLDLDSVSVVHQEPAVQDMLANEVGMPRRHTMATGLVLGAIVGALVGGYAGSGLLSVLGPLLAAGLGAVSGAAIGAAAAVLLDTTRVPEPLADDLLDALSNGATVVSVRTANLPTARAIRDLFEAGGSRLLQSTGPDGRLAEGPPPEYRVAAEGSASAYPAARPQAPVMAAQPDHDLFAPPWRRTPFAAGPRKGIALSPDDPTIEWSAAEDVEPADSRPTAEDRDRSEAPDAHVADLSLSPRVVRALLDAGVITRGQLVALAAGGEEALDALPGIGPSAIDEILAITAGGGKGPGTR